MLLKPLLTLALLTSAPLLPGCASAVSSGTNTALDGVDLVRMTDDMANKIAAAPQVRQAIAEHGPLKVVCEPVENRMTAEILPQGQKDAFIGRVRTLLSKKMPDRFIWVMERDAFYRMRQQELAGVEPGPDPDAVNPQYILHATFQTITQEDQKHRSSFYLCTYFLTDLTRREVLWTDEYKVKKIAAKQFLD